MSAAEDEDLVRLAQAIADGTAVDWSEETRRRPDLGAALETLRIVGVVVGAHRERSERPAGATRPVPIGTWGPFELLERLGQGSFGEVHRAWDPALEREVALKLFSAPDDSFEFDAVARARREEAILDEARRLARIRHPNVLVVHGAARHDGRIGMWADLLEGETLDSVLARQGPFGAREAANVGLELCRALSAVHAADLVHRDVKAANVMRERGGRIVLMDFGAVSEIAPSGADRAAPAGRVGFGSPIATAPEQLRGETIGPAADLYALGVLLYRLLTGSYPIEADSLEELSARHERGERVPLRDRRPDLPGPLVRVVERALSSRPGDRFPSAGAMEEALAGALEPPRVAAPSGARVGASGRRWLAVSALATVVVVGAASVFFARRGGERASVVTGGVEGGPVAASPADPANRPPSSVSGGESDAARTGRASIAPTARPIVAQARLFRQSEAGDEPLLPGARIAPGDELFLELASREPLHVYVLNEDDRGEVYVLFPAPQFDATNPLAPEAGRRLPGTHDGKAMNWQVTSAGGTETVLVVASRVPLAELEREIAAFPRTDRRTPGTYGRLSGPGLRRLRGIGGMAEAETTPARPSRGRLSGLLRDFPAPRATDTGEPWVWQIELSGPLP